jgi:hypothetical protein
VTGTAAVLRKRELCLLYLLCMLCLSSTTDSLTSAKTVEHHLWKLHAIAISCCIQLVYLCRRLTAAAAHSCANFLTVTCSFGSMHSVHEVSDKTDFRLQTKATS